jgi:hypothetical protein
VGPNNSSSGRHSRTSTSSSSSSSSVGSVGTALCAVPRLSRRQAQAILLCMRYIKCMLSSCMRATDRDQAADTVLRPQIEGNGAGELHPCRLHRMQPWTPVDVGS